MEKRKEKWVDTYRLIVGTLAVLCLWYSVHWFLNWRCYTNDCKLIYVYSEIYK